MRCQDPLASGGSSTPFVVAITGLSIMASDISTKRLQLLKEAIPALKRVGVVWDASIPWHESTLVDLVRAAGKLGVQITPVRVKDTDDFASTFSQMRRARVQALFMLDSALLGSHSVELLKLAGEARLPVACGRTKWAEQGALLSYSADFGDMFRRAAKYVDRYRALVSYVKRTEGEKPDEVGEFIEALTSKRELPKRIGEIGRLRYLRQGLDLVFEQSRKPDPVSKYSDVLPLFAKVLARADESVRAWGGKLYFVYLPEWEPFGNPVATDGRREVVLEAVKTLGIPVIDIHRAFQDQKDPLALFPFRVDGHYNEEGHRVVAEAVLKSIPAEN